MRKIEIRVSESFGAPVLVTQLDGTLVLLTNVQVTSDQIINLNCEVADLGELKKLAELWSADDIRRLYFLESETLVIQPYQDFC